MSPRLTQTKHRKFCECTEIPYIRPMRTVIETPTFQKQAKKLWSEAERHTFIDRIAEHPLAGDVIKGACGARKVRRTVAGRGKSGGVRVIYFKLTQQGVVVLVMMYTKAGRAKVLPTDIDGGV